MHKMVHVKKIRSFMRTIIIDWKWRTARLAGCPHISRQAHTIGNKHTCIVFCIHPLTFFCTNILDFDITDWWNGSWYQNQTRLESSLWNQLQKHRQTIWNITNRCTTYSQSVWKQTMEWYIYNIVHSRGSIYLKNKIFCRLQLWFVPSV